MNILKFSKAGLPENELCQISWDVNQDSVNPSALQNSELCFLVRPYRSRLVGERAPPVEQCLADEEKNQQRQQDSHTGDRYRAHHRHQQLVTVPSRPPSHTLGGRS